jgi:hypothetical protein
MGVEIRTDLFLFFWVVEPFKDLHPESSAQREIAPCAPGNLFRCVVDGI